VEIIFVQNTSYHINCHTTSQVVTTYHTSLRPNIINNEQSSAFFITPVPVMLLVSNGNLSSDHCHW